MKKEKATGSLAKILVKKLSSFVSWLYCSMYKKHKKPYLLQCLLGAVLFGKEIPVFQVLHEIVPILPGKTCSLGLFASSQDLAHTVGISLLTTIIVSKPKAAHTVLDSRQPTLVSLDSPCYI